MSQYTDSKMLKYIADFETLYAKAKQLIADGDPEGAIATFHDATTAYQKMVDYYIGSK
jgi:hypothetical protein